MSKINTFIIPLVHGHHIEKYLETLYRYTEDNFYVFVIDQTVDDEAYVKYRRQTHFWIRSYRNLGFSKAMNTGLRLCQTPYVTFSNDDIEFFNKRWWNGLLETFSTDKKIIAVNPMSPREGAFGYGLTAESDATWIPPKGFVRDGEFVLPEKPDGTALTKAECFTEAGYDFLLNRHPRWQKGTVCDGICMWCTTFKADALKEIGPFDERFYPGSGEDYDMNGRAYSCGWPYYQPECKPEKHHRMVSTTKSWVWHHWSTSKNYDKLELSRDSWNDLGALWPEGFDSWGHGTRQNDVKYPYRRVPDIHIDEI